MWTFSSLTNELDSITTIWPSAKPRAIRSAPYNTFILWCHNFNCINSNWSMFNSVALYVNTSDTYVHMVNRWGCSWLLLIACSIEYPRSWNNDMSPISRWRNYDSQTIKLDVNLLLLMLAIPPKVVPILKKVNMVLSLLNTFNFNYVILFSLNEKFLLTIKKSKQKV